MYTHKITIFTATYNRAHMLPALYDSIQRQTFRDFEWLVIDDGSADDTPALFESWLVDANDFPIRYIRVPNGGKHRALNKGGDLADGDLFFIVDSDDMLTENSLAVLVKWAETIEDRTGFAGVHGLKGYSLDRIVGTTFHGQGYVDATYFELDQHNISGDKADAFFIDVFKQFKFPEIEGERFLTEFICWSAMARAGLKIRWFNDIIYLCQYYEDGLTRNIDKILADNPVGYAMYLHLNLELHPVSFRTMLYLYYSYYQETRHKLSLKEAARQLHIFPISLCAIVGARTVSRTLKSLLRRQSSGKSDSDFCEKRKV
jgi:glycosyltransferase involved in cell wall biosynthesis